MGFIMFLYGVVATKINKKIGIVFLFYQLFLTFAWTKTKSTFSYMYKNRVLHFLLLLSCCMWGSIGKATLQNAGNWKHTHPISVERRLNEQDGLSHHHATSLVQDKNGMIWVATWNGLSRYDGYRFVSFKPKPGDGCSMDVNRIKDIRIRDPYIYCNVEGCCFLTSSLFQDMFVSA